MKHLLFFSTLFLSLVSCKKDYTCECTVNGVIYETTTIRATKKKAEDSCNKSSTSFGVTNKCEIK